VNPPFGIGNRGATVLFLHLIASSRPGDLYGFISGAAFAESKASKNFV